MQVRKSALLVGRTLSLISISLSGAMWIRRSFGDDALYTTLVQSYIDTLLQEGYNFECFVGTYISLVIGLDAID